MTPPVVLTIAGSDCSAGAGMQADLKTFSSFGLHGLTAVTCVVSETPLEVSQVHAIPPEVLHDQIRLLLNRYPIAAIKTGMLYSRDHIAVVCDLLAESSIPLVVDPVMVASTGDPLLLDDALAEVSRCLLPLATVITPNLPEASFLLGRKVTSPTDQEKAALDLASDFGVACYLKGGHLKDRDQHRDLLADQGSLRSFTAEHLELPQTHGTGCTLSAALAAGLALGQPLEEAAAQAHHFTHQALRDSFSWPAPNSGYAIWHLNQIASPPLSHPAPRPER